MENGIYEAPTCEVLNIEPESMICTSGTIPKEKDAEFE